MYALTIDDDLYGYKKNLPSLCPKKYPDFQPAEKIAGFSGRRKNQRTNGPVNAHLISGPYIIQILNKMAVQTLTLITHNPSFTHSVYYINQIPGHMMQ